jgi:hypothetical protein
VGLQKLLIALRCRLEKRDDVSLSLRHLICIDEIVSDMRATQFEVQKYPQTIVGPAFAICLPLGYA